MYTISEEDLMAAKAKLEGINDGKKPEKNTALHALIHSVAETSCIKSEATGVMFLSVMGVAKPDDIIASAIALGTVIGFQAGLTRAVDEPVKALVESVNIPTAAA